MALSKERKREIVAEYVDLLQRSKAIIFTEYRGLSNKEIANNLGVGVRTVESHREHIMAKLGIHTVAGLTKFAISKGLVSLSSRI